jgi:hypothetical protein
MLKTLQLSNLNMLLGFNISQKMPHFISQSCKPVKSGNAWFYWHAGYWMDIVALMSAQSGFLGSAFWLG